MAFRYENLPLQTILLACENDVPCATEMYKIIMATKEASDVERSGIMRQMFEILLEGKRDNPKEMTARFFDNLDKSFAEFKSKEKDADA